VGLIPERTSRAAEPGPIRRVIRTARRARRRLRGLAGPEALIRACVPQFTVDAHRPVGRSTCFGISFAPSSANNLLTALNLPAFRLPPRPGDMTDRAARARRVNPTVATSSTAGARDGGRRCSRSPTSSGPGLEGTRAARSVLRLARTEAATCRFYDVTTCPTGVPRVAPNRADVHSASTSAHMDLDAWGRSSTAVPLANRRSERYAAAIYGQVVESMVVRCDAERDVGASARPAGSASRAGSPL